MKERPSTIPKQLVLLSKEPFLSSYKPLRCSACGTYNPLKVTHGSPCAPAKPPKLLVESRRVSYYFPHYHLFLKQILHGDYSVETGGIFVPFQTVGSYQYRHDGGCLSMADCSFSNSFLRPIITDNVYFQPQR